MAATTAHVFCRSINAKTNEQCARRNGHVGDHVSYWRGNHTRRVWSEGAEGDDSSRGGSKGLVAAAARHARKRDNRARVNRRPGSSTPAPEVLRDPIVLVELGDAELGLLIEALDSHLYWQLTEEKYRSNGDVLEPGSDDEDNRAEARRVVTLAAKLWKAVRS